jgi:uncharacterized coiled-coil protein SlyX
MKTSHRAAHVLVPLAMLFAAGSAIAWAQARSDEPGSMTALIAEVRQLRLAVEESSRQQAQIQGLSVYLSAQQSRLTQIGAQLDAVRNELANATARAQEVANLLSGAQTEATRASTAEEREQATEMARMFKKQAAEAAERERQIRERELALAQTLQNEEGRWVELVTRLEQSVKR